MQRFRTALLCTVLPISAASRENNGLYSESSQSALVRKLLNSAPISIQITGAHCSAALARTVKAAVSEYVTSVDVRCDARMVPVNELHREHMEEASQPENRFFSWEIQGQSCSRNVSNNEFVDKVDRDSVIEQNLEGVKAERCAVNVVWRRPDETMKEIAEFKTLFASAQEAIVVVDGTGADAELVPQVLNVLDELHRDVGPGEQLKTVLIVDNGMFSRDQGDVVWLRHLNKIELERQVREIIGPNEETVEELAKHIYRETRGNLEVLEIIFNQLCIKEDGSTNLESVIEEISKSLENAYSEKFSSLDFLGQLQSQENITDRSLQEDSQEANSYLVGLWIILGIFIAQSQTSMDISTFQAHCLEQDLEDLGQIIAQNDLVLDPFYENEECPPPSISDSFISFPSPLHFKAFASLVRNNNMIFSKMDILQRHRDVMLDLQRLNTDEYETQLESEKVQAMENYIDVNKSKIEEYEYAATYLEISRRKNIVHKRRQEMLRRRQNIEKIQKEIKQRVREFLT